MTKKDIDRGIINLLISTLITLVVWVGLEVYRAYTVAALPQVEKYLQPLDPTLDTTVLEQLEQRELP